MKIAINKSYGNFTLSNEAIIELHKRGCTLVTVREPKDYYYHKYNPDNDWEKR